MRHIVSCLLMAVAPAAWCADDDNAFFQKQIQPILENSCYHCHGADKQKARLRLDSRDAILKGGKHGPAAVPGKPDDSLLIKAVRYTDDDLQMPPKKQLSDEQVKALVDWVQRGMPWPQPPPQGQVGPPPQPGGEHPAGAGPTPPPPNGQNGAQPPGSGLPTPPPGGVGGHLPGAPPQPR